MRLLSLQLTVSCQGSVGERLKMKASAPSCHYIGIGNIRQPGLFARCTFHIISIHFILTVWQAIWSHLKGSWLRSQVNSWHICLPLAISDMSATSRSSSGWIQNRILNPSPWAETREEVRHCKTMSRWVLSISVYRRVFRYFMVFWYF